MKWVLFATVNDDEIAHNPLTALYLFITLLQIEFQSLTSQIHGNAKHMHIDDMCACVVATMHLKVVC